MFRVAAVLMALASAGCAIHSNYLRLALCWCSGARSVGWLLNFLAGWSYLHHATSTNTNEEFSSFFIRATTDEFIDISKNLSVGPMTGQRWGDVAGLLDVNRSTPLSGAGPVDDSGLFISEFR
jgi:hypothetical protein